jgi:hypothetical protein
MARVRSADDYWQRLAYDAEFAAEMSERQHELGTLVLPRWRNVSAGPRWTSLVSYEEPRAGRPS